MAVPTQMNLSVSPDFVAQVDKIAERYGWSKVHTIRVAVRALADVMSKHEDAPRDADHDIRDLYLRLSREIPGQLVEVSRSVEFLYVGDVPAVRTEGWLFWEDDATGELLARETEGEQRFGRVIGGRIEAYITPAQAGLN